MKIIYSADLHGLELLYIQLLDLARDEKAETIIIGGDILPKHGPFQTSIEDQRDFIKGFLRSYLSEIHSKLESVQIYGMMGNDDWLINTPHLEELEKEGLFRPLHNRKWRLGDGMEIVGYGNVPPTSFSIKDGERIDIVGAPMEPQTHTACISTRAGITQLNPNFYFRRNLTMEEELTQLPVPESFQKTIYVMHAPPFQTNLDHLYDGRHIGSRSIRQFIEKNQPYLTLHGHIHESPRVSGKYWERIGNTLCINPGQSTHNLHAVVFDLKEAGASLKHTLFE